ncbi:ExeA family protein [Aeoliella sp. SH292]|uniref:ExeA family protein n=1 Tax=Aeoliella sp. SH292 TaxID=3454464 RepID=UPI003F980C38
MLTIADLANSRERVFPTHARVERYYPAAAAEHAREVLGRCLDRGEGPALLIGSPGTGKSMLLNVLADDLGKNRPVVFLTSAQLCTRRALLQSILFELGQSYRQRDEGDLRLALMDYLRSGDTAKSGVLLLVDEAQSLPVRLLEEIRILGNTAHQGVPIVRLLLAGSAPLEETFNEPEIEAFNQRIAARCYLAPLNHHDTVQYVRGHLAAAGASPDQLFTADALDSVYRATDGIARLVNQVCDRALVLAAAHKQKQVTKDIVQGAWADLQQLPTPWNLPDAVEFVESHADDDDTDIVEFGPLSDDHADDRASYAMKPAARIHQPELSHDLDLDDELELEPEEVESLAVTTVDTAPTLRRSALVSVKDETAKPQATTQPQPTAPPKAPSVDDLFGDSFEEEEMVIDEFLGLEQTIPPSRARVSSACDAELSRMLSAVMRTNDERTSATSVLDPPKSGTSFAVVDAALHEVDELPLTETELDEEADELLTELNTIAHEAQRATIKPMETKSPTKAWTSDDLEELVIEDEMSLPMHSAAAQRADYRQLFKSLRDE